MQTRGGSSDRAGTFSEYGLIALAVRRFIGALDVRRQWNMTEALEMPADAALVMRSETQRAQAKPTPRENFGFQFSLSKENSLSYVHLAARPNERLPSFGIEFAGEEDLDFSDLVARDGGCEWTPARLPNKRAGMTRALLSTRSSSPRRVIGNSVKRRSSKIPEERFRDRSREASRRSRGRCAISSRGRR